MKESEPTILENALLVAASFGAMFAFVLVVTSNIP